MAAQTKGGDFSAQGLGSLSRELGLAALERAIREGMTQVGACRVDWRRFAERNSLLETPGALEGLVGRVEKVATAAEAQPEARDVRSLLGETAGDDRRRALLRHLEQVGREVLEFDADQSLDQDEPLSDQGFDSLLAVEFRNKLGRVLGASLPPTLLFDHPSLGEVADFLLAEVLPDNGGPEAGKGEDGPTPAPEPVDDTMDLLREIGRIID
jgi:acyl carrier protein